MYGYPPGWLIFAAITAGALPLSAIFGLAAAKAFDWWSERQENSR